MSRDRFRSITSNLHMSDPEEDSVNDQKRGTDYDPLQKVRSLLEIIRNCCKSVYHPKQHISVDERVATKARLSMKQYMKAKPTKCGLKLFVLADVNGYTVDYKLYTGKNHGASGKGLSFDVVVELVNKDYLGSGYIVYCDNFYTSLPLLFHHLSQQGQLSCPPTNKGKDTEKRQKASMGRKQCTVCHKSTPWMCEKCKVGLCLQLERNCFRDYHCS
ncbi:hypothetical protein VZT92_014582 [Zoarces viviparus]|uniref:PiggyBac transposable element-derived protein domain-containing protein n=1 Tax=Zoarces viviparus TaxID=48416 RepID=A0AAW1F0A2_ZOAVI